MKKEDIMKFVEVIKKKYPDYELTMNKKGMDVFKCVIKVVEIPEEFKGKNLRVHTNPEGIPHLVYVQSLGLNPKIKQERQKKRQELSESIKKKRQELKTALKDRDYKKAEQIDTEIAEMKNE